MTLATAAAPARRNDGTLAAVSWPSDVTNAATLLSCSAVDSWPGSRNAILMTPWMCRWSCLSATIRRVDSI